MRRSRHAGALLEVIQIETEVEMQPRNKAAWETLTPEEKRRALYDRQVATLKTFHEHGAITQAQHDKSLHDLTVKMGYADE